MPRTWLFSKKLMVSRPIGVDSGIVSLVSHPIGVDSRIVG